MVRGVRGIQFHGITPDMSHDKLDTLFMGKLNQWVLTID